MTEGREAVAPEALLSATLLVVAPHMDDELLGCGGLMLLHEDKRRVHCVYASDGARSPKPLLPWQGLPPTNLTAIRKQEAIRALTEVGIPPENLSFLDLPDGGLSRSSLELRERLVEAIARIQPDYVLVPFRYDLHSDHVAVQRAARALALHGRIGGIVLEYFVYVRWPLIPGNDIRRHIEPGRLVEIDCSSVATRKLSALEIYRSQTSKLWPWQESSVLTAESLRRRCEQSEQFLESAATEPLTACFSGRRFRLLLAHYAHRFGKRRKDQTLAFGRWVLALAGRSRP